MPYSYLQVQPEVVGSNQTTATNKPDRDLPVLRPGAFSFATKLSSSLPWPIRIGPLPTADAVSPAGIPAAAVVGPGVFWLIKGFYNCRSRSYTVPINRFFPGVPVLKGCGFRSRNTPSNIFPPNREE